MSDKDKPADAEMDNPVDEDQNIFAEQGKANKLRAEARAEMETSSEIQNKTGMPNPPSVECRCCRRDITYYYWVTTSNKDDLCKECSEHKKRLLASETDKTAMETSSEIQAERSLIEHCKRSKLDCNHHNTLHDAANAAAKPLLDIIDRQAEQIKAKAAEITTLSNTVFEQVVQITRLEEQIKAMRGVLPAQKTHLDGDQPAVAHSRLRTLFEMLEQALKGKNP